MDNKDIIDVEFREKDSTEVNNDTQTIVVHTENQDNTNNTYEQQNNSNPYGNVKVVKLHPIVGLILFVAICIIGFLFAGVIAIIVCVILGIIILAGFATNIIKKFKR